MITKRDYLLMLISMLFFMLLVILLNIKSLDFISKDVVGNILFLNTLGIISTFLFTVSLMRIVKRESILFKHVFTNANDSMSIIDKTGSYIWQNSSNMLLTGERDNIIKGKKALFFINDKEVSIKDELDKLSEFSGIFKIKTKYGYKDVWISAFKICDEFKETLCYVEIKRDVNEFFKLFEDTKKEKQFLEREAMQDFLTKVLNRNGLLREFRENPQYSCVVFVDIDKFKNVNDTYGHQIGDVILVEVATILKNSIRKSDVVARWGGEEFIMLIDAPIQKTIELCEKIRVKIENANPNNINISCSFGVAEITNCNLEEGIKIADDALYEAKNSGRNRVIYKTK